MVPSLTKFDFMIKETNNFKNLFTGLFFWLCWEDERLYVKERGCNCMMPHFGSNLRFENRYNCTLSLSVENCNRFFMPFPRLFKPRAFIMKDQSNAKNTFWTSNKAKVTSHVTHVRRLYSLQCTGLSLSWTEKDLNFTLWLYWFHSGSYIVFNTYLRLEELSVVSFERVIKRDELSFRLRLVL